MPAQSNSRAVDGAQTGSHNWLSCNCCPGSLTSRSVLLAHEGAVLTPHPAMSSSTGLPKKATGLAVAKLQHIASLWSGIKQPYKHCIPSVITVCHRAGLPTDVLYLCSPHNHVYPSAGVSFLCPPSSLPDCEIDQLLLAVGGSKGVGWGA